MSQQSEIFFAPATAIPQIVDDLHMVLQSHYQIKKEERMSQGYELQASQSKFLAVLGLSLNKTIYISGTNNGKISCEISSGEFGELVLPGILTVVFLFIFLPISIIIVACAIYGLKKKKEFDRYIFKEIEKFSEQYKSQATITKVEVTEVEHKCSKCGNILDSPGFCPNCGTKVN